MQFANQTVIVTGGTGALGRAVVGIIARVRRTLPCSVRRRGGSLRRFPTRTALRWSRAAS